MKSKKPGKISIVMPVFNEKHTIKEIIRRVEQAKYPKKKEIIIVDDCSTDGTRYILKKYEKKYKVIYHEKNTGVGGAVKTGFQNATGDIIIIQHTDLEYHPDDYPSLLKPILDGRADVVLGSRFIGSKFKLFGKKKTPIPMHYIGNKCLNVAFNMLYGTSITDMETASKVFRRDVIEKIKIRSHRFEFEPEVTAKSIKAGFRIKEVPIQFTARGFDEGKKITWRDGIRAVYAMTKFRLRD